MAVLATCLNNNVAAQEYAVPDETFSFLPDETCGCVGKLSKACIWWDSLLLQIQCIPVPEEYCGCVGIYCMYLMRFVATTETERTWGRFWLHRYQLHVPTWWDLLLLQLQYLPEEDCGCTVHRYLMHVSDEICCCFRYNTYLKKIVAAQVSATCTWWDLLLLQLKYLPEVDCGCSGINCLYWMRFVAATAAIPTCVIYRSRWVQVSAYCKYLLLVPTPEVPMYLKKVVAAPWTG